MTNPLDQLNLRPQERRVLVVVTFLIFVALNYWFVRPLFGQFGQVKAELEKTRGTLGRYQAEIAKAPNYERLENDLKKSGSEVLSEELQLQRIVDNQARAAGVMVSRYAPGVRTASGRTNQFFEDQGLTIDFTSTATNMVEFLVGLASGNSMIRVQDMNLRPDGAGTKLVGNILFVASYQKKQPVARPTSGSAPKPVAAAVKPATNNPSKPVASSATKPATNTSIKPKPILTATNAASRATNKAGLTNAAKIPKK